MLLPFIQSGPTHCGGEIFLELEIDGGASEELNLSRTGIFAKWLRQNHRRAKELRVLVREEPKSRVMVYRFFFNDSFER